MTSKILTRPTGPASVGLALARTGMSLARRVGLAGKQHGYHKRAPIPLTVLETREKHTALEAREESQREFASRMGDPQLFTAAFVETMTSIEIAALLDACFYDLVRAEKR